MFNVNVILHVKRGPARLESLRRLGTIYRTEASRSRIRCPRLSVAVAVAANKKDSSLLRMFGVPLQPYHVDRDLRQESQTDEHERGRKRARWCYLLSTRARYYMPYGAKNRVLCEGTTELSRIAPAMLRCATAQTAQLLHVRTVT